MSSLYRASTYQVLLECTQNLINEQDIILEQNPAGRRRKSKLCPTDLLLGPKIRGPCKLNRADGKRRSSTLLSPVQTVAAHSNANNYHYFFAADGEDSDEVEEVETESALDSEEDSDDEETDSWQDMRKGAVVSMAITMCFLILTEDCCGDIIINVLDQVFRPSRFPCCLKVNQDDQNGTADGDNDDNESEGEAEDDDQSEKAKTDGIRGLDHVAFDSRSRLRTPQKLRHFLNRQKSIITQQKKNSIQRKKEAATENARFGSAKSPPPSDDSSLVISNSNHNGETTLNVENNSEFVA